jgi:hypothetical protein
MNRPLTMYALCALVLLTLVDARRRLRSKSEKSVHKETLKTWEDEGGALR